MAWLTNFVIGLTLTLLTNERQAAAESPDAHAQYFQNKAINLWMTKAFLHSFEKCNLPSESEVNDGLAFYNQIKAADFTSGGISGAVADIPINNLKELVSNWEKEGLITPSEKKEQDVILLEESMFKTVRESVRVKDNGELIYGVTGFLKLSNKEKKGTIAYVFRKFKLNFAPDVILSQSRSSCILFDSICKTTVALASKDGQQAFSLAEGTLLGDYMRAEALKAFAEDNRPFIAFLDQEAERYRRFLPQEVSEAVKKLELEENKNKRLDEIFEKDPFDGNVYDL